jgi:hypothetical protein
VIGHVISLGGNFKVGLVFVTIYGRFPDFRDRYELLNLLYT